MKDIKPKKNPKGGASRDFLLDVGTPPGESKFKSGGR